MSGFDGIDPSCDARVRFKILHIAQMSLTNGDGFIKGGKLFGSLPDFLSPSDVMDDKHAVLLVTKYLVNDEYLQEKSLRRRKGDPHGLDWVSFRITAKGLRYLSGAIDHDPMIEDGRLP